MKKYLLTTERPDEKTAWSKARVDVSAILENCGYSTLYFPQLKNTSSLIRFYKTLSKNLKKNDHLVIEYPFSERKRAFLLYLFRVLKGIKIYALIHDLNTIRFQKASGNELTVLRLFDGLISHNSSMTKWLSNHGIKNRIVNLDLFDYRNNNGSIHHEFKLTSPVRIIYAGNLSYKKATFLYNEMLATLKNVELSVYGQYFEKDRPISPAIIYKGIFDPDSPQLNAKYHFGLIWEGTSIDSCEGEYGHYLRYNNPHKLSLYISLGLPVVVWEHAAIADIVLKNNIGVTIRHLSDLEHITTNIPEEKYQIFAKNVAALSIKVRNGNYLEDAIHQLVS